MLIARSPAESSRFGVSVGRLDVGDQPLSLADLANEVEGFDVVIARVPAARRNLSALLAQIETHLLVPADHLCYWSWTSAGVVGAAMPTELVLEPGGDMAELAPLVRDAFADYGNHYSANPLFDPVAALDGYCEWVERLIASDATCLVLRSADRRAVGFGLIDWSVAVPDVRLAAMASSAQGRGWYRWVLSGLMDAAVDRGHDKLVISTQSDNTNVMRAWARLGLLPERTLATHHLVRRSLLGA